MTPLMLEMLEAGADAAVTKHKRQSAGDGPPCRNCSQPMRRWTWHDFKARAAQTGQGVYRYWYECANKDCQTPIAFMPPEAFWTVGTQEPDEREPWR